MRPKIVADGAVRGAGRHAACLLGSPVPAPGHAWRGLPRCGLLRLLCIQGRREVFTEGREGCHLVTLLPIEWGALF